MLVSKTTQTAVIAFMRNPFKTRSFQSMFFLSFLLFAFLLVGLLGTTSYLITNEEIAKQTIQSRKLLLNEINKQLNVQMKSVESDSLAISSNPRVLQYLQYGEDSFERFQFSREVLDLLSRPSYIKEAVQSIQLFAKNKKSDEYLGSNGIFSYDRITHYSWFDQIKDADNCWIGEHPVEFIGDSLSESKVVSFARKVLSSSGREIGILVVNINLSSIQSIVAGGVEDGNRYILDSSNRLITEIAGKDKKENSYSKNKTEISRVLGHSANQEYAVSHLGEKELMIWSKQQQSNWISLDMIPWSSITRGSDRIRQVIQIAAITCVVLAVLMACILSSQFVKPIRRLIRVMGQVDQVHLGGGLGYQIKHNYQNEFGNLYQQFNQMISRIRQLLRELNEQNRKKREAELQVLQEQINPHFIYNTLDIINWHAIEYGARDVSRMLSLLGKMLRIGLSRGASFITVKKEIEHLTCYIELQKIRYHHKIDFSVAIEDTITECFIPKLLIQPFVENALLHAFHASEKGSVSIGGRDKGDDIEFTVRDDGLGIKQEGGEFENDSRKGGINNVDSRIQLYFGRNYGVRLHSEPQTGTIITILLPKLMSDPSVQKEDKIDV